MRWLWNRLLAPLFKGVLHVLTKSFSWAVANPVLATGAAAAFLVGAAFAKRPWVRWLFLGAAGWITGPAASGFIKQEINAVTSEYWQEVLPYLRIFLGTTPSLSPLT